MQKSGALLFLQATDEIKGLNIGALKSDITSDNCIRNNAVYVAFDGHL